MTMLACSTLAVTLMDWCSPHASSGKTHAF